MAQAGVPAIGDRIRTERLRRGQTVRGLARSIGVSASLISQIETSKSRPSVSTLYAITTSLGISVADLLDPPTGDSPAVVAPADSMARIGSGSQPSIGGAQGRGPMGTAGPTAAPAANSGLSAAGEQLSAVQQLSSGRNVTGPDRERAVGPLVRPADRELIELDSGVTWERLGQIPGAQVDFLLVTYQPGGTSSSNGQLMRHAGTEYGYLLSGRLTLRLGFDEHQLTAGDAVSFSSSTPHGYRNDGVTPAVGVWLVLDLA